MMDDPTVYDIFRDVCQEHADAVAYSRKVGERWVETTWGEAGTLVGRLAKALIRRGVQPGDRVAILSQTRLEWALADFAIVTSGAVTVGIYQSDLAEGCEYILNHSEAVILFVENADQLEKILSVQDRLTSLREIVVFDGPSDPQHHVLAWAEFLASGDGLPDATRAERAGAIQSGQLASLVYTSGTTGRPKGVMLSHSNLVFTSDSITRMLPLSPEYTTLLFLPLAHVFARMIAYSCMRAGVTVAFAESIDKVAANIREVRPHFIPSVPRVYEKIYDKIVSGAESSGGLKRRIFEWSLGVGRRVSTIEQSGRQVPPLLGLQRAIAHRLVFHKIQAALGGRLAFAVSGAAPLNPAIAEFFHACGITILEGIGMTENTSFSNVNTLEWNKFGTVGRPGPGIEVVIAEDGEVLTRGKNTMLGYYKDPEASAETIDAEGWLHSGDIGEIDADGFLKITDRKKDLIITAGGKNVAPQRIEKVMRTSHYIAHVVAYGDRRKFISALITLDEANVRQWARERGIEAADLAEIASRPEVRELVAGEVARLNEQLASFESIKKFHILPQDLTIEAGELTPTLKIKRRVVFEKYARELDALYA